jgi:hypothetical protein
MDRDAYLARIGLQGPLPATLGSLHSAAKYHFCDRIRAAGPGRR